MIRIRDFALEDGSDQTDNICAAVAAAMCSADKVLDITGGYSARSMRLHNVTGLQIIGRGQIWGIAGEATPALLDIRNPSNLIVNADWTINGAGNQNYENAVWTYAAAADEHAAYCRFNGLRTVNTRRAWKFGMDSMPNAQVSEIEITGSMMRGCPSGILAVGAQTVVEFIGGVVESSAVGVPANWAEFPQQTIVSRGATVIRTGGQTQHVDISSGGTDSTYNTLIQIEAISAANGLIAGNVNMNGGVIETAVPLATTNTGVAPGARDGAVNVRGVRGVSMGPNALFIATDGAFAGRIMVRDCDFFSENPRVAATAAIGNTGCKLITDTTSFGRNFLPIGSGAFVGGTQIIN